MWLFVSCIYREHKINFPSSFQSESAHDFAEALKVLSRHACDEHKWDGGKCTFHELKVCSCGKCEDDADTQVSYAFLSL